MLKRAMTIALILGTLTSAPPASAYPRPGLNERVSVASDGSPGNLQSVRVEIAATGRFVVFESVSTNLVPADTNGSVDIFVRDRVAGTTEVVSVANDGAQANGGSLLPGISADGRYVVFMSHATNLVPGDTNRLADIFVRDRVTGTTERVSVSTSGLEANAHAEYPVISGNGMVVVWESEASNLVPGDTNFRRDIFFHDRQTSTTGRASLGGNGAQGTLDSRVASVTADGRHVAFQSSSESFVPGDRNQIWDVFLRDLQAGTTERVSLAGDGSEGNYHSLNANISADGRYVAFYSEATNLVPVETRFYPNVEGDDRGLFSVGDIYVRDRLAGTTERVSVSSVGEEADDQSASGTVNERPSISDDGRYVAFRSKATNLVSDDTNGAIDIFLHDRATREIQRVNLPYDRSEATSAGSAKPSMTADGRFIAFNSTDPNLVPDDTNEQLDVFVRDLGAPLGVVGPLSVTTAGGGVQVSGQATLSGAVVTAASDPYNDAGTAAHRLGAELTGAQIVRRPQAEDLLLRLQVTWLPPVMAGLPGILYGASFEVEGVPYEIRALRATADDAASGPHIALYRCRPNCTPVATLPGAFGTTGPELLISIPEELLGIVDGPALGGVRAFTAIGDAGPGVVQPLDQVSLPSAAVTVPRVEVGVAPGSTSEGDVAFTTATEPADGLFAITLDASSFEPGPHRVWARACDGQACGAAVSASVPG